MSAWLLAGCWGALTGKLVVGASTRLLGRRRARALIAPTPRRSAQRLRRRRSYASAVASNPFGNVARGLIAQRSQRRHATAVARQLALATDLIGVAVNAGTTPLLGVQLAAEWAPPQIAVSLTRVSNTVRLGVPLPDALAGESRALPALRPLTDALLTSYRLGSPLGPTLQRVSAEARAGDRRRAEARARTVPVRLLFPLVFLVLPAFGLLTVVPALIAGWHSI